MRLDVILNTLCLVKTRSLAKKACDLDLIRVNGKVEKASYNVKVNDMIELALSDRSRKVEIKEIPRGNVSRGKAVKYYEQV